MKRYFSVLFFSLCISGATFAQGFSAENILKNMSISWGIHQDIWKGVPDSIIQRGVQQGANFYINYNFNMTQSGSLRFFVGLGFDFHNFYVKNALLGRGDDNLYHKQLDKENKYSSYFYNIPKTYSNYEFKKSKLAITYLDIPFGFKYTAPNGIVANAGFKVGWRISSHTKYKGTDFDIPYINDNQMKEEIVIEKKARLQNLQSMHYGPFLEVGYKWVMATASYQITPLFEKNYGPQIYPISVGVTFRPF